MNKPPYIVFCCILLFSVFQTAYGAPSKDSVPNWEKRLPPPCPWAKPLVDGPINLLVICPAQCQRDLDELSRRIDVVIATSFFPLKGDADEHSLLEIENALEKKHDVIVLGNVDVSCIPKHIMEKIIAKSKTGTGVLIIDFQDKGMPGVFEDLLMQVFSPVDNSPIVRGIGHPLNPEWGQKIDFVSAFSAKEGEGRLVRFSFHAPAPKTHIFMPSFPWSIDRDRDFWECYYLLIARTLFWLSGRKIETQITSVEPEALPRPDPSEIPPDFPKEYIELLEKGVFFQSYQSYIVNLEGQIKKNVEIVAQLRTPGRNWQATMPVRREGSTPKVTVFAGPGNHLLDIWLRNKKKQVIDWYSEPISIRGFPEIKSFHLSKPFLHPHDELQITVDIKGIPTGQVPTSLYMRAFDSYGRLVAESFVPVISDTEPTICKLSFQDLLAPRIKVELFGVFSDAKQPSEWDLRRSAYAFCYVPVIKPAPLNKFRVALREPILSEYHHLARLTTLSEMGIDEIYTQPSDAAMYVLNEIGLSPVFEIAHVVPETVLNGTVRVPSLSDSEYMDSEVRRLIEVTRQLSGLPTPVFSLGWESCLSAKMENVCQSKASLQEFRKDLIQTYQDLLHLNDVWHTQFSDWSEVVPASEDVARTLGPIAPWMDFRRFMDRQFSNAQISLANAVRQVRPDAKVGIGAPSEYNPYTGYDCGKLLPNLGMFAVQADPLWVEKTRSYLPHEAYAALILKTDGKQPNTSAIWYPWYALFHGFNALWLESDPLDSSYKSEKIANAVPDFEQTLLSAAASINRGFSVVLHKGKEIDPQVVIYDSQASRYLSYVSTETAVKSVESERAFVRLLEDLGVSYRFVDPETFVSQSSSLTKLVVLPACHALQENEVDAFVDFLRQGGFIAADILPGTYDEHGTPREKCVLWQSFVATAPIENKTASEANTEGNTQAFLLGEELCHYPETRTESVGADIRKKFFDILTRASFNPPVRLRSRDFQRLPGAELRVWQWDNAVIFGLLADPTTSTRAARCTLEFSNRLKTYDMLSGKQFPSSTKLSVSVAPGKVALFSRLPYEVKQFTLETPKRVTAGNRLPIRCAIKTTKGEPGRHPVFLEIMRPQGTAIKHYDSTFDCERGLGEAYISLSLNEAPGPYIIKARDILTGLTAESVILVDAKSTK